jgi:signal transduction histidine kinase
VLTSGIWRTTTFRLSILFGVIFALGIILLLGMVYLQTAGYLTHRADRALTAEAAIILQGGPDAAQSHIEREAARDPLNSFGLFSMSGERIAGATQLVPDNLPLDGTPREIANHPGAPARALAERMPWGEILIVEREARQLVEVRRIILGALVWSGATIVVLGLASGVVLSFRPLRRIQAMRAASEIVASGDFRARLPVDGSRDELDELARIANQMMDEAERLMIQARTVGEGMAHELRTPLTRLRAALDHACEGFDAADPRQVLLERCVTEADGMLARFQALLRIAALEARGRHTGIDVVSLNTIVDQIAELYEPVAAARNINLEVENLQAVSIKADGELLLEAMSNLVDNALKFTSPGGRVHLTVAQSPEGPVVQVTDNGPGIPKAERALVVKRFYRSQRDATVEGHGLGLSLVAAVAELHGFELSFNDADPGVVVRITCRTRPVRPGSSASG